MANKHRRESKTASQQKRRRKDQAVPEKTTERPRTIGQILLLGAANPGEEAKLADYRRKQQAFFKEFLPGSSLADHSVHAALYRALRDLCITRGELRHAIQTQHRKESRVLLKKVSQRADELLRSGASLEIPAPRPEVVFVTNKLIGFGGYPADSCQVCGRFLRTICYSQIQDCPRVPRTDKICSSCFERMDESEQREFQQYHYSTRWEPWEPWGNTPKP